MQRPELPQEMTSEEMQDAFQNILLEAYGVELYNKMFNQAQAERFNLKKPEEKV